MKRFLVLTAGIVSAAMFAAGCDTMPTFNDPLTRTNRDYYKPANAQATGDSRMDRMNRRGISAGDKSSPRDMEPAREPVSSTDMRDGSRTMGARGAMATIKPAAGMKDSKVSGIVTFSPAADGVTVHADVTGLEPKSTHGIHIHQSSDLSAADLASAGAHFNPGSKKHGGPTGAERHAGDLGNLNADDKGHATIDETVSGLSIDGADNGVVGKSVIIHASADDLKSDPAGNSGARIAGGAIQSGAGAMDKAIDRPMDRNVRDSTDLAAPAPERAPERTGDTVKPAQPANEAPKDMGSGDKEMPAKMEPVKPTTLPVNK